MSASFLVPFALHVKPSDECESLHAHVGPLLTLLSREDHAQTRLRTDGTQPSSSVPGASCAPAQISELLTPVRTPPVPRHDPPSDVIPRFVARTRHASACEEWHVRLLFKEYCQRKSVECAWQAELERLSAAALPPAARESLAALAALAAEEAAAREGLAAGAGGSPSDEALRRRAIAMIEREQAERRRGQAEAIEELRAREAQLRAGLAARAQRREEEADADRIKALDARARELAEAEAQLRRRLDARAEQRNEVLTHVDAEEEMLRVRIAERDRRRGETEAEAQRIEQQRQDEMYEHVRAEEELLRVRIAERDRRRDETEAEAQRIEQQRQDEMYEHVRAEEELLRDRIAERERRRVETEAEAQRIEQQRQHEMYEHVRAEEELLRVKIAEHEQRRVETEAEAQRIEQQRQREMYEHVRAEEELLRERIAEHEQRRVETEAEAQRIERQRQDEMYEHVRAEEELLRVKIAERERRREEELSHVQREHEVIGVPMRLQQQGVRQEQLSGEQSAPRHLQNQTGTVRYHDPMIAMPVPSPSWQQQQGLLKTPPHYQPYQKSAESLDIQSVDRQQVQYCPSYPEEQYQSQQHHKHHDHYRCYSMQPYTAHSVPQPRHYTLHQ